MLGATAGRRDRQGIEMADDIHEMHHDMSIVYGTSLMSSPMVQDYQIAETAKAKAAS